MFKFYYNISVLLKSFIVSKKEKTQSKASPRDSLVSSSKENPRTGFNIPIPRAKICFLNPLLSFTVIVVNYCVKKICG